MRLKYATRILILIISFNLFNGGVAWGAQSPAKPGAACKKVGMTQKAAGKTYICVLSGKKNIWKISAVVKLPSDKTTEDTKQTVDVPLSGEAKTNAANYAILLKAFADVRSYINVNPEIKVSRYSDLSQQSQDYLWVSTAEENVLKSMSGLFPAGTSVTSVISNSNPFIINSYGEAEKKLGLNAGDFARSTNQQLNVCPAGCAFASRLGGQIKYPVLTYSNIRQSSDSQEVGAHELFHTIQASLDSNPGNLPCWIHEGGASFIGSAFAAPSEKIDFTLARIRAFGGLHSAGSNLSKIEAPTGWSSGGHGPCNDVGEYQVGRIANIFLVGTFGWQKYLDYLKAMNNQPGNGESWKTVFESTFGVTVPYFYSEATPYIDWYFRTYPAGR